jgi:peptidyl-prolyl cis-trans isomerase D
MPSNDSNTPTTKESKVTKFKQKGKEKISFGRIITYVILALIAIALIFSVVLPSFSRQGQASSITFGTLDGKPIEFRYGNYFYRQYQNLAQQNKGSSDAVAYQIWRGAFENTVIYTALNKMAVDVGYKVTDEKLNQAIIDSGAYNRDGKFDTKLYEQTPADRKKTVKQQIEENLPLEAVMNDISSLLTASGELDYIMSIGDKSRSFEYALFDYSLYPDALATNYGQNNVALFSLIDIDVVNAATLEEVNRKLIAYKKVTKITVLDKPMAVDSIPRCNLVFTKAEDGYIAMDTYLKVLQGFDYSSIGGSLPDESFYLSY